MSIAKRILNVCRQFRLMDLRLPPRWIGSQGYRSKVTQGLVRQKRENSQAARQTVQEAPWASLKPGTATDDRQTNDRMEWLVAAVAPTGPVLGCR